MDWTGWGEFPREGKREGERLTKRQRRSVLQMQDFIEKLKIMESGIWKNLEERQKMIFTDTNLHIWITYTHCL